MPLRRTHHSLPRFVQNNEDHIELNGFSDASIKAYFAVIYIRVVRADGTVSVSLIAGKTRVAPLKQQSLPRLEHHLSLKHLYPTEPQKYSKLYRATHGIT